MSYPPVPKYPYIGHRPIPGTASAPPATSRLPPLPTDTLQATPRMRCCSSETSITLSQRNTRLVVRYNHTVHSLRPLQSGDAVLLQRNGRQWDTTGRVVEALPNRQYQIRVDGSGRITLRNRRFLRKLERPTSPKPIPSVIPSASPPAPQVTEADSPVMPHP